MGRAFMFCVLVWLGVCLVGQVSVGNGGGVPTATTTLTAAISDTTNPIPVASTQGFAGSGTIIIGNDPINGERVAYTKRGTTSFQDINVLGVATNPLLRGYEDSTAQSWPAGTKVRTASASMMNAAASYNVAVIADASGGWAGVTIALALMRLIGSFLTLPTSFMGTDLALISYLWWVLLVGMIVTLGLALAGSRRI